MQRYFRQSLFAAFALAGLAGWARAQEGATVTGRVTSEGGAPLAAASVFIEGMNLGTLTRDDGQYSFSVPAARVSGQSVTLTARLLGFRASSVTITLSPGTITQNFTLPANPLRLGEVVVTGAGTVSTRERLGNVINSVDSSLIQRATETNIVQSLAGKAPNVYVNQQSGEPGASSQIRIRGAKSITGTGQPLFIVDGVPIDNTTYATGPNTGSTVSPNRASDINPGDIASVDILKGSAAAAIYGARAAEGVVLITTKSGRSGETRYSLRSTITWDDVTHAVPLQRMFGQGSGGSPAILACLRTLPGNVRTSTPVRNCRLTGSSFGPRLTEADYRAAIQQFRPTFTAAQVDSAFRLQFPEGAVRTYDHWDELFRTGNLVDNTLSASGGNERTSFYASVGRVDHRGVIAGPNNEYERTSVRIKADHRIVDRLRIGGNVSYVDVRTKAVQKGSNLSGLLLGGLRTSPDFNNQPYMVPDPVDPSVMLHRSYRFPRPDLASLRVNRTYDNPFFTANEFRNLSEVGRVFGSVNLDYDAFDWLSVKYALGGDYYGDWRLEGFPIMASGGNSPGSGELIRADIINYQIDHNLTATASHTFSPALAGRITLGQNLNSRRYRLQSVAGYTLVAPEPFALQNAVEWLPTEDKSLVHAESYFVSAQADLFDQLYIEAAARNDGFSTFGQSDPRHWFPKASAAWLFTNFLGNTEQTGLLSYGKLRLAYGETGKEPLPYQTLSVLNNTNYFTGWGDFLNTTQNEVGGLGEPLILGNNAIKPERTREVEGGIDLGLFNQRVDLSLTLYDARSTDVILAAPRPASTGYAFQLKNAAEISNKGAEVTLNIRPLQSTNFAMEWGFLWATNEGEVLDLEGAEFVDKSAGSFTGAYGSFTKGEAPGVLRGEDFHRCGHGQVTLDGRNIDALCGANAKRGALFIDADGFPVIDPTDRVIADPNPDWTGSVRTSMTFFRKWNVTGLLDIKKGGDVWNGTRGALINFGAHKDTEIRGQTRTFGRDFYTDKYPDVAGPGAGTAVTIGQGWFENKGSGFNGPSAQFIEDGSYVKLREVSLAYTLDMPWVRGRLGLSTIDLRVAGRNLKTWTDYTGIDPETNLAGAEVFVQGIDYFNNPQTRSIVLAIGLNR